MLTQKDKVDMAINMDEFTEKLDTGLRANKKYTKFFYRFKKDGITKRGIINYEDKDWGLSDRKNHAKAELLRLKSKQIETKLDFTENSSLNKVADTYFELMRDDTKWTKELMSVYSLYCRNKIGKKKIKDIRQIDIDKLRKDMENGGFSQRTEDGCSPRTIKKVLKEVLKPILQYTVDNKILEDIPPIKVPKQHKKKKMVQDGGIKLSLLYNAITKELYYDDGFYRALFLFALYGRRWNEIRTLRWSDINFVNHTYTIRKEVNKINEDQTYDLPEPIIQALTNIDDNNHGLVFKSPITQKELSPPKRQLNKIKIHCNIPELTMHYFRHILVTAMGEVGTATTILSASLGHTNLQTVNDFYLSANHQKSSKEANLVIDNITNK